MVNWLVQRYSNVILQAETEAILGGIFKCSREELYLENMPFDGRIERLCDSIIDRRLSGEPLQYLIGSAAFMDMDFIVDKNVFIPRPETELLVDEVFHYTLHFTHYTKPVLKILDLCTGCGNIAIALATLMDHLEIVATDISAPALEIAQRNAAIHKVASRITFYKADLFQGLLIDKKYKFDIIVSNPPYVKEADIESLQKEVGYEPKVALDGGPDGLDFYRRIADEAGHYLKEGGDLFLEIGFGQLEDIADIFRSKGIFKIINIREDFAKIDRVLWINLS